MDLRTLRELAAPNLTQQHLCITYPTVDSNSIFELKSGLIHLLPFFHGLSGEEPHKHLQEFDVVCTSMKPQGVTEDQIKFCVLTFPLKDTAKDWLFNLTSGNVITWTDMKRKFLEKYFPASQVAIMRKEICGMTQRTGESLFEYWDRFNALRIRCTHHQIVVQLRIQYFYEGLTSIDKRIIDATSGGALINKTPREAWDLLNNMAMNSQQVGPRETVIVKEASEVISIKQQLTELISFVQKFIVGKAQVKACRICTSSEHPMDICPTLNQDVDVSAARFIPRAYNHYSNSYNPRWKDHPNLKCGNQQANFGDNSRGFPAPNHPPQPPQKIPNNSLEDMMKTMASNILQFQHKTQNSIRNL
ncbi:uncharacterized protein LOC127252731 [Andrographis paniculata]|uniref:uncharacterized protein LOC127252731 n=1 Tax=Andrographis paniculata TaxID=175694 RepID=UPI0021E7CACE|nr:uncharacterized protein LOC127252731 [Andrographis paniculata]